MSSFCTAKATHIFLAKKIQHICVSLDVNFNESLTNDVVSFEQLGPVFYHYSILLYKKIFNKTKPPIFVLVLCVLCFQWQPFR